MSKLAASVFKTLALMMIFIFVADMANYLYRVLSLNQRMESIMVSMQDTVRSNNYLPEKSYEMYLALFAQLANDMNGQDVDNALVVKSSSNYNWFVDAIDFNYDHNAVDALTTLNVTSGGTHNILRSRMDTRAGYGDVMVVQARVCVEQPHWEFIKTAPNVGTGGEAGSAAFQNDRSSDDIQPYHQIFTYTYYVPCLNYQAEIS